MEFITLRHATPCNIAKQGTYKAWFIKETVGAANNWAIGSYCQRMASNDFGNKKIVSSLYAYFWWRNAQVNIFTLLKYRAFFSTNYKPSELYQGKFYMDPSPPPLRGCMCQIGLWCGIVTLRYDYDVMKLGVFWHMVFEGEIRSETDPTSMLTVRSRIFWHT